MLGCACLAVASPAAGYAVVAKAGVTLLSGGCSDSDDSGVLAAPSASASALCSNGAAQAFADLATASIGLLAVADSTATVQTLSTAEAELLDVVHFQVPPAMSGQPFTLGVAFTVDGVITPDADPYFTALLSSRCILTDVSNFDSFDGLFTDTTPVSGPRTVSDTIQITPPDYSMNVSMHMLAPGLTEGTIDFLTTGELQLAIPPDVTYTSDSGVFHAPEPGSAATCAAACAALAFARRARRPS
ncbi:MAG: hypothetical protein DCC71_06465 [Proteobacteria bacterium]|nr:MAG: hypothetical protein DCC71_06465 [Pseudomonadota bacterium]